MKKAIVFLLICVSLFFAGCSNAFAKAEYDAADKIAKVEDRYAKVNSVFNPIDGGYSLEVSKFDGRETLWSETIDKSKDIEIEIHLSLSSGKAKIVHINDSGDVLTLMECTPETVTDDYVTKNVSLSSGVNRIKIVGSGCKDLDVKILSSAF